MDIQFTELIYNAAGTICLALIRCQTSAQVHCWSIMMVAMT